MERIVKRFIKNHVEDPVEVSKLTMEIRHDLAVTQSLIRRRTTYMLIMGGLSLLIVAVAVSGIMQILEFTPGVFTLLMLHLSSMFVISDLLRGVHLDTLRARLRYPELYTADGRYYKSILSHEAVRLEAERLRTPTAEPEQEGEATI